MGFELSRLQIMEVREKRYQQALVICPGHTVTENYRSVVHPLNSFLNGLMRTLFGYIAKS